MSSGAFAICCTASLRMIWIDRQQDLWFRYPRKGIGSECNNSVSLRNRECSRQLDVNWRNTLMNNSRWVSPVTILSQKVGDKPSTAHLMLSFSYWMNGRTKEAPLTYVQGALAVPHSLDVKAQTGLATCSCRRLRKRRLCSVKRTKHYLSGRLQGEVEQISPRKKARG